jgi:gamma-glutamyl-gamma-aminobutyrate hydrolase PuuD
MNIGLSQRVLFHKNRAHDSIEHGWYRFLSHHALHFIPNIVDQDFDRLASTLDLLILTGGDDSHSRVITETKIATAMMKQSKPILGVCHGAFLLTDLLGGSLVQCEGHMDTQHDIVYDNRRVTVDSYHNNAIDRAPDSAQVLAMDDDGHCEAWIDNNIGAVVWHPERMAEPFLPDEITEFFNDKRETKNTSKR